MKTKLTMLLAILSLTGLAQCGGKSSSSSKVSYKIITPAPIIVNADLTYTQTGATSATTISANWFMFGHDMINGSTNKLYWVTSVLKLSGSGSGTGRTATVKFDPGTFCTTSSGSGPTRAYIATLTPGGEYTHVTDPCDPATATGGINYDRFYAGGLDTSVSSWSVEVSNVGWFVDSNEVPIEALVSSSAFQAH